MTRLDPRCRTTLRIEGDAAHVEAIDFSGQLDFRNVDTGRGHVIARRTNSSNMGTVKSMTP